MPDASGIVGIGPFKKKKLDYIVPVAVYRHLAGQSITRALVAACLNDLYAGVISSAPAATVASPATQQTTTTPVHTQPTATVAPTAAAAQNTIKAPAENISDIKSRSSLSIAHLMTQPAREKEREAMHKERSTPFTESAMRLCWAKYANRLQEEKKSALYTAMSDASVSLGEDYCLEITVGSDVLASQLESEMIYLMEYLKKELDNEKISHKINVSAQEKEHIPYTPREKYEYLKEKNPMLVHLRAKLNLNIEF